MCSETHLFHDAEVFPIWGGAASREADNSLPSSAYTKNEWSYASIPHMCTNSLYRDDFTCYVSYHKNFQFKVVWDVTLYVL